MGALLEIRGLRAGYGAVRVLHGLDVDVAEGEVVVILGANGAGKTTTLRAVSQLVATEGSITLAGADLTGRRPEQVAQAGIAHVPQGRGTLADLTVEDNLRVGAFRRRDRDIDADLGRWFEVFPRLGERRRQRAGSMSGGEQQMLAIARALMSRPRLLLLDEPSLGLAPIITAELFSRLRELNTEDGLAMLVVEQNASLALDIAARGYVIETGEIVATGTAAELRDNDDVRRAYLGV